jgi:hypothetical protein
LVPLRKLSAKAAASLASSFEPVFFAGMVTTTSSTSPR